MGMKYSSGGSFQFVKRRKNILLILIFYTRTTDKHLVNIINDFAHFYLLTKYSDLVLKST